MKAKPDCTGQRFGRLIVLGKSDRVLYGGQSVQRWLLRCDCGNTVNQCRSSFDRADRSNQSCGCGRRRQATEMAIAKAKPDCSGQKFAMLTVLSKNQPVPGAKGRMRSTWNVRCDCGNVVKLPRSSFESDRGNKSCGCLAKTGRKKNRLIDNKKKPLDLTGDRYGLLTLIRVTPVRWHGKAVWECLCDCGAVCFFSVAKFRHGHRLHCGDPSKHKSFLHLPETPSPYPEEAGRLLVKYLPMTELEHNRVKSDVEDEKRDRLIRACWILTWRRQQGELISASHEKGYISKCLRFASISAFHKTKKTGIVYDGAKHKIGSVMTDLTSQKEAVNETQPNNSLSNFKNQRRIRFKRA